MAVESRSLRHAVRGLARTPAFTVAAILTLALGIGAVTAIFTLVNAALLRPLPYPDPERLFLLARNGQGLAQSGQTFLYVRDRAARVDLAAQGLNGHYNLDTPAAVTHVVGMHVSAGYFAVHGVSPLAGRDFSAIEDAPNGPPAVVISDALWARLFDRRPEGLGQAVRIGGVPHTVVGVMPPGFRAIPEADVLLPLATSPRDSGQNYRVIARLRPGAALADAQRELEVIRADAIRELALDPQTLPRFTWTGYRGALGRTVRQPMLVLLGAVACLLLIACVNVASLNIARALAREREMATRVALGAGRARVLRGLLAESLVVAAAGGLLGLLAAAGTTRLLRVLVSDASTRLLLSGETATLDWRVFAIAAGATLGAALLFGVAPMAVLGRLDVRGALDGARTTTGRRTHRLRRALAVAEVALAVVLTVGAGLLVRTFVNLTRVDLGFTPSGVTIGRMTLRGASLDDAARRAALFDQALDRIGRIPGVTSVAAANHVPVEPGLNLALQPPAGGRVDRAQAVDWRYVTPEYFAVFDIALLAGRAFDATDRPAGRPVAIVNEAFARAYFDRLDVIGETVQLAPAIQDAPREIVGVVADVKARSNTGLTSGLNALAAAAAPTLYVPAAQASDAAMRVAHGFFDMTWVVRSGAPSSTIEPQVREALRAVDPTLPFVGFEPMTAVIAGDLDLQRLLMVLMAAFAGAAMLLAGVGLSGLIAYTVAQRTREVGVRMALGATASAIVRLLAGEGVSIAMGGVALGTIGALLLSQTLPRLLYGVAPIDLLTFFATAALLAVIVALASFIPSAAAARIDPVRALRAD